MVPSEDYSHGPPHWQVPLAPALFGERAKSPKQIENMNTTNQNNTAAPSVTIAPRNPARGVLNFVVMLRDTNLIVRHRAFDLLQTVSGQDISPDEPAKWEQWWAANKAAFNTTKPAK